MSNTSSYNDEVTVTTPASRSIVILCEDSPLSRVLEAVLNLIGWTCTRQLLIPDTDTLKYYLPRLSSWPTHELGVVILLHEQSGKFYSSQYCSLAAKLRCPPLECDVPIIVWSDESSPLCGARNLVCQKDLDPLHIVAAQLPESICGILSEIQRIAKLGRTEVYSHQRSLPIWTLAVDIASQSLEHDMGNAFREGRIHDAGDLMRRLVSVTFSAAQGKGSWTMPTRHILFIDDALDPNRQDAADQKDTNDPDRLKYRATQALAALNVLTKSLSRTASTEIRYAIESNWNFDPQEVANWLERSSGPPRPVVILDLGDDADQRSQDRAKILIEKVLEPSMPMIEEVYVWTAAHAGIAYDLAEKNREKHHWKIYEKGTNIARIAQNIDSLPM